MCIGYIPMFKTEADSPAMHLELDYKVPILDIAVWVEDEQLPAPGMVDQKLSVTMPGGKEKLSLPQGWFPKSTFSSIQSLVQLSISAYPWQQKQTAFTQEVIRRLLRTNKEQTC